MFSFALDAVETTRGQLPSAYLLFFVYVWSVWSLKALAARSYRPSIADPGPLAVSALVPVNREPEAVFRHALASVRTS